MESDLVKESQTITNLPAQFTSNSFLPPVEFPAFQVCQEIGKWKLAVMGDCLAAKSNGTRIVS